ncbi:hypothetical protein HDK77DRAFT_456183, partial [Phyllosticta capitalensis]
MPILRRSISILLMLSKAPECAIFGSSLSRSIATSEDKSRRGDLETEQLMAIGNLMGRPMSVSGEIWMSTLRRLAYFRN